MKKLGAVALSLAMVLGIYGAANALPFIDVVDFGGAGYISVQDTPNTTDPGTPGYDFAFTYTHNVTFDPAAATVDSAKLSIKHKGNQANRTEAWFVWNDAAALIGYLSDSQGFFSSYWVTDTFVLPSSLLAGVSGSLWTIAFRVDENTLGFDEKIYLDWSKLYGEYTPVPEPATLLLLGAGLIGLAGYSRRKLAR